MMLVEAALAGTGQPSLAGASHGSSAKSPDEKNHQESLTSSRLAEPQIESSDDEKEDENECETGNGGGDDSAMF